MSIYESDCAKNLKFIVDSTDITEKVLIDTFSCESEMCKSQLEFGACSASRIQFKTTENLELAGKKVYIYYGDGETEEIVGVYKVTYSSQKENTTEATITGYDIINEFNIDLSNWYVSLTFPMSLHAFRTQLCERVGVEYENEEVLVNDNMPIHKTINPSKLNGLDILKYIGEINGVFPIATRNGKFKWKSLSDDILIINPSIVKGETGFTCKSYETDDIGSLVIRSEDGDIGVTSGTGNNKYVIQNNILCYGLGTQELQPIADNLFVKIQGISYTPAEITIKWLPNMELGAKLNYNGKIFYCMKRKITGMMFEKVTASGNQYLKEVNTIESSIEQLRGKSNVLNRSIEATQLLISDVERGLQSEIEQTSEEISLRIEQLSKEINGEITVYQVTETPTLDNYPADTWFKDCYYPPYDDSSAEDYMFPGEYTWEFDADAYSKHLGSLAYQDGSQYTYKFIKNADGQYEWLMLSDTETSFILSKISNLELTTDGIKAEVEAVTADLEANYLTETQTKSVINQTASSITSQVTTETTRAKAAESTLTSKITQTADSITSEVTRAKSSESTLSSRITQNANSITSKVSKGAVSSEISQEAGQITISSNRLAINSTNFSLTNAGKITAKGADIEGNIKMTNGSINIAATSGVSYIALKINDNWKTEMEAGALSQYGTNGNSVVQGAYISNYNKNDRLTDYIRWDQTRFAHAVKNSSGGTVFTSDRNAKENIEALSEEESVDFIMNLRPVQYTFKIGSSNRLHHGFIAQEVKEVMKERDWGVYTDEAINGDYDDVNYGECTLNDNGELEDANGNIVPTKGIRYDEIIADLVCTIQSLNKRIEALEKGE